PDGAGGAFVTGDLNFDAVGGTGTAVLIHHVRKDGPPTETGYNWLLWSEMGAWGGGLASDGDGGVYVAGHDAAAACQSEDCQVKVYVGRFDADLQEVAGWPLRVRAGNGAQVYPELASDGAHGVFVLWAGGAELFLQHVLPNATKDPAWPPDGVPLGVTL